MLLKLVSCICMYMYTYHSPPSEHPHPRLPAPPIFHVDRIGIVNQPPPCLSPSQFLNYSHGHAAISIYSS